MINIGANVDETQIRTAIETAIRKISPNATIDIVALLENKVNLKNMKSRRNSII